MTVEQFRALPETRGDFYYELHHGELVKMTRPKPKHWLIQKSLMRLFEAVADPKTLVGTEFAFCPEPEHQLWCADVAYLSPEPVAIWDIENDFRVRRRLSSKFYRLRTALRRSMRKSRCAWTMTAWSFGLSILSAVQ